MIRNKQFTLNSVNRIAFRKMTIPNSKIASPKDKSHYLMANSASKKKLLTSRQSLNSSSSRGLGGESRTNANTA